MRRGLIVGFSVLLIASSCSSGVSGPQKYAVDVDAASPEGKNFQYSTYFPSTLKVRPGDSVSFVNRSTQAPHTISFGVEPNRSNQPPAVLPAGLNPAVFMPCFAEEPPSAKLSQCPHEELPAYGGTGYWNSGVLVAAGAAEGTKEITLEVASSIKPGQYRYLCILHGPMSGVLEVVAEDADRESTEKIVELGAEQLSEVRTDADAIDDPEVKTTGDTVGAAAGWGNAITAVNRFFPETVEVKAGQMVSWEAFSTFEPHTVSFGAFEAGSEDPKSFAPSGLKSGGSYAEGDANSGIFGKKGGPFPPGPFTLRFPTAGEYKYVCTLHPEMVGSVKVT